MVHVGESTQAIDPYAPRSFDEVLDRCKRLVASGFLGPHIKDANQALAIELTGRELGLPLMASFRRIYVHQQRVGLMTAALVAKVKSSPLCKYFITVELTDTSCTVETLRSGSPAVERYTYTIEMARAAGYADRNPKYKSEPRRMLYARAAGYLASDVYPDVTLGIDAAETLADESAADREPIQPLGTVHRPIPTTATPAADPPVAAPTADEEQEKKFVRAIESAADSATLDDVKNEIRQHYKAANATVPKSIRDASAARAKALESESAPAVEPGRETGEEG